MTEEKIITNCGLCGGTGKYQLGTGAKRTCFACGGKGKVLASAPATKCKKCGGAGRIGWQRKCDVCDQTGWVGGQRILG